MKEVDHIEVLSIIDNYVDFLVGSTDIVTRPPRAKGGIIPQDTLLAEHGLSLLITVHRGQNKHTVLFDAGYNSVGVLLNLRYMGVRPQEMEAVVLSHGHMDHTGALKSVLDLIQDPVPLVVHPDAFLFPRYMRQDDGTLRRFPQTLVRDELEARGAKIVESKGPAPLAGDTVLATGEVERVTDFETGLPNALLERDGKMEKDPMSDDQALIINLRRRGLVVICGCSHAGVINTLLYARKVTGISKIHAVFGGFHLSGSSFEPIIDRTVSALKEMEPQIVVPMHCTGWKAVHRFSEGFPSSFILNGVGSKYNLVGQ